MTAAARRPDGQKLSDPSCTQDIRTHILAASDYSLVKEQDGFPSKRQGQLSLSSSWVPRTGRRNLIVASASVNGVMRIFQAILNFPLSLPHMLVWTRLLGSELDKSLIQAASSRPKQYANGKRLVRSADSKKRVAKRCNRRLGATLCRRSLTAAGPLPMAGNQRRIICQP
jgi:hypothetical protein